MSAAAPYAPSARPLTQLACERPTGRRGPGERGRGPRGSPWVAFRPGPLGRGPASRPPPRGVPGLQHCAGRSGVPLRPPAAPRPARLRGPRRGGVAPGSPPPRRGGSGVPAPGRGVWVPFTTAAAAAQAGVEPLSAVAARPAGRHAGPLQSRSDAGNGGTPNRGRKMALAFPVPIRSLFTFGTCMFGASKTLGYFMPTLKYRRPLFMMHGLKRKVLYFVLGISEYGPFLAFFFDTRHGALLQ